MMLVANRFTHQPERENYKKFLKKHVRVRLLFTKYAHYVVHYTEHLLKWHLKWCTRTWAGVLSGWTVLPSHAGRSRRSEGPAKQNIRVNASKTVYKNIYVLKNRLKHPAVTLNGQREAATLLQFDSPVHALFPTLHASSRSSTHTPIPWRNALQLNV